MDFNDILVIILMFAVPIMSAVIDSRKKAKKKAENAPRRAETFRPFTSVDPEMPEEEDEEYDDAPEELKEQPVNVFQEDFVEGRSSIPHAGEDPVDKAVQEPEEKEKIDVRKLIVYDAILNPKFKEQEGLF